MTFSQPSLAGSSQEAYPGLVVVELTIRDRQEESEPVCHDVLLNIAFDEGTDTFAPGQLTDGQAHIKFGLKRGQLHLHFQGGSLPAEHRALMGDLRLVRLGDSVDDGVDADDFKQDDASFIDVLPTDDVAVVGANDVLQKKGDSKKYSVAVSGSDTAPVWTFQAEAPDVLAGQARNCHLGNADIEAKPLQIRATFSISDPCSDIDITEQNGLWSDTDDPLKRETKKRAYLKYFVLPQLEACLRQVVVTYE